MILCDASEIGTTGWEELETTEDFKDASTIVDLSTARPSTEAEGRMIH